MRTLTIVVALIAVASSPAATRQLPGEAVPPLFVGAIRQIVPPEPDGSWVLQLISRGGLDGRGAGDLAVSSDGALTLFRTGTTRSASSDTLSQLREYVAKATASQWAAHSRLGTCSDCVATLMALTLRQPSGLTQTYTIFWDVTTKGRVPADALRIHAILTSRGP